MDEILKRFLPQFCVTAQDRIRAAQACIADAEAGAATLVSEFHTMAGEAAMLGLAEVADVARSAEAAARTLGTPEGKNAAVTCARALRTLARAISQLQASAETHDETTDNTTEPTRKQRVLVVDDSPISAALLCDALVEEGFEAEATDDEQFGTDILSSFQPVLVVTDVQMPKLDCKRVCDLVKSSGNHVSVLLVSGLSDSELQQRAKLAGAHAFVSKGGGLEPVVARVKAILAETPV